jgi:hypothetical protein
VLISESKVSGFSLQSYARPVKDQAIRFGVGTADEPYVPVWRIWAQRSDAYLSARDIAGTLKISLHESGEWVTQFTTQSGIRIDGASRRVVSWQRPPPFADGWVQGPSVVVPAVEWAGELNLQQKGKNLDKVEWFAAPKAGEKLCFIVLFASKRGADIAGVSIDGDMHTTEPLQLENGGSVWLQVRYVPLGPGEPEHLNALDREFRAFSTTGQPAELSAAAMEVFKDQPLVIQFPLGLRHFTFDR